MSEETQTQLDAIIASEPAPAAPAPEPVDVGDVVIFHDYTDVSCECTGRRAAIVTAVWSARCVNLLVLGREGQQTSRTSVMVAEEPGQPLRWERK